MQIQNQMQQLSRQTQSSEQRVTLKKDDIVTATVKDVNQNGEATLMIRGKEVQAKFEGELPSTERATVQIQGEKDGALQVKVVANSSSKQIGQQLGIAADDSPELKQAVTQLLQRGVPLSKEAVNNLRQYLQQAEGTVEQRLATIEQFAVKKLEITPKNLQAVHQALHGKDLGNTLQEISNLLRAAIPNEPTAELQRLAAELERTGDVQKVANELRQLLANQTFDQKTAETLNKVLSEVQQLQKLGKEALARQWLQQSLQSFTQNSQVEEIFQEVINKLPTLAKSEQPNQLQQLMQQAQQEADAGKAIQLVKEGIQSQTLTPELAAKAEASFARMDELHAAGRELKVRQEIQMLLTELNNTISPDAAKIEANEQFQTSVQLSTKDFIVREVSQKLAEMTEIFREIKRDVTRNLENVQRLLEQAARPQARQILENTIRQLDNAILKSDAMLYADMKTEKTLLQSSSQLAEARNLLAKGNHQAAAKIVQEVKAVLEKLNFQPADIKVKRFIAQELQARPQQPLEDVLLRQSFRQEPTARAMFEMIRSLGLNHESEVARSLLTQQPDQQQNVKTMLMQLMREGMEQGRAEHALTNITGQQLLSKSDTALQSMMFSLPFLLKDEVKDLQVFIKSKNKGEQVDWENCNLYFLIETKKLGEVGISVTTSNRNLSITIKNDNDLKEKMGPLAEVTKEKLSELGYNVSAISFTKTKSEPAITSATAPETPQQVPTFGANGMDFKI